MRGPTSEIATEYAETLFDGTGQNLTLLKSGHLCIIPGVPAVDEVWKNLHNLVVIDKYLLKFYLIDLRPSLVDLKNFQSFLL